MSAGCRQSSCKSSHHGQASWGNSRHQFLRIEHMVSTMRPASVRCTNKNERCPWISTFPLSHGGQQQSQHIPYNVSILSRDVNSDRRCCAQFLYSCWRRHPANDSRYLEPVQKVMEESLPQPSLFLLCLCSLVSRDIRERTKPERAISLTIISLVTNGIGPARLASYSFLLTSSV